ncbi:MAG: hypothetical protein VW882_01015 [Gammaproteobacteria bacterium]
MKTMRKLATVLTVVCMLFVMSTSVYAAKVETKLQNQIRSSVPFPEFLSTGPYVWYEDAKNKPIRGHAYRIATFTIEGVYRVYLEKVNFGHNGCCLEIVDYRELMITEDDLAELFPDNSGPYGFKLINWESATSFVFEAFGGRYVLTDIETNSPTINES